MRLTWKFEVEKYYENPWWNYVDWRNKEVRGVYRMTQHGWWDVRTWYFALEFTASDMGKAKPMYLSPVEYNEADVRRIIETAWSMGKNEEHYG